MSRRCLTVAFHIFAICLAVISGCGASAIQVQAATADAIGRAVNASAPLLVQAYELDCSAAVDHAPAGEGRAALADCRARWRPAWQALDALAAAQRGWIAAIASGQLPDFAAIIKATCEIPPLIAHIAPQVPLGALVEICGSTVEP